MRAYAAKKHVSEATFEELNEVVKQAAEQAVIDSKKAGLPVIKSW